MSASPHHAFNQREKNRAEGSCLGTAGRHRPPGGSATAGRALILWMIRLHQRNPGKDDDVHRDQQGEREPELLRFEGPASRGAIDDRHGNFGDGGSDQECDRQAPQAGGRCRSPVQVESNWRRSGLRAPQNEPSGGRMVIKDSATRSGGPTANPVPADPLPENRTASTSGISIAYKTSNPGPKAIAPSASRLSRDVG